eukprot:289250-Rhodomonas_salina.1
MIDASRGSRVEGRGSRIEGRESRVEGRDRREKARGVRVDEGSEVRAACRELRERGAAGTAAETN